ncbi:DNA-binding protein, partial [Salmonella enterica subsp. enterica serovar Enteritidis]|nr:DNA-binding protein [Salmonella enterica subsp. enterica serovar Enteritidis]
MKFNGQVVTAQVMDHNEKEVFAQYEGVTLAIDR